MQKNDSITSRMFATFAAANAIEHPTAPMVNLSGNRDQVLATAKVVSTTRALSDILVSNNPRLEDVMKAVDRKNNAAVQFLQHVGSPWPL